MRTKTHPDRRRVDMRETKFLVVGFILGGALIWVGVLAAFAGAPGGLNAS